MNNVIDCLYNYMLEYRYSTIITHPDYQNGQVMLEHEQAQLEETLTAEQKKQFRLYVERANALTDLSLEFMFRETLFLLRGLFLF